MFLMRRVELKADKDQGLLATLRISFLMHRVELKVAYKLIFAKLGNHVPNAPCGVESWIGMVYIKPPSLFLMYRVELKGLRPCPARPDTLPVPNAPCEVESLAGGTLWQGGIGS